MPFSPVIFIDSPLNETICVLVNEMEITEKTGRTEARVDSYTFAEHRK